MVDKVNALLPWVYYTIKKTHGVHSQRPTSNFFLAVVVAEVMVVVVHEWTIQHVRFTMVYHT